MELPFPEINACLNAAAASCLTAGYIFIRAGQRKRHMVCMVAACSFSAVFLASYLTYHYQTGAQTPFPGTGFWRGVYYTMLITHIFLAVAIVPLVPRTVYLAIRGRFEAHRRWARVAFPIWYYVSVTGVLIYFFLYQWFQP
jgi:uncharacterized membrane protein YozB (DUF420 family)